MPFSSLKRKKRAIDRYQMETIPVDRKKRLLQGSTVELQP